jgi:hypothetical protein
MTARSGHRMLAQQLEEIWSEVHIPMYCHECTSGKMLHNSRKSVFPPLSNINDISLEASFPRREGGCV